MSFDDFKSCARTSLGDQVDAWNEEVIQPLIQVGHWFKGLNDTVQWLFGSVAAAGLASLVAWLAKIVGVSSAEVVAPILLAFAAGVGVGTGLNVVIDCADRL